MAKHGQAYRKIPFLPVQKNKWNFCHLIFVLAWHILKEFCGFFFCGSFTISTLQGLTQKTLQQSWSNFFAVLGNSVMYTPQYKSSNDTGKLGQQCPAHAILANTSYLSVARFLTILRLLVKKPMFPLFPGQPILWSTCQHYQWDFPY